MPLTSTGSGIHSSMSVYPLGMVTECSGILGIMVWTKRPSEEGGISIVVAGVEY